MNGYRNISVYLKMNRLFFFLFFFLISFHIEANDYQNQVNSTLNQSEISLDSTISDQIDSLYFDTSLKLVVFRLQTEIVDLTGQLRIYQQFIFILFLIIAALSIGLLLNPLKKIFFSKFPLFQQKKGYNAGLVSLQMILKYYGKKASYKRMKKKVSENDFTTLNLIEYVKLAKQYGLDAKVVKSDFDELINEIHFPVILCFNSHTAVLFKIDNQFAYLADPYYGLIKLYIYYFLGVWYTNYTEGKGIAVVIYPGNEFGKKIPRRKKMNKLLTIKEIKNKEMVEYQVG